MSRLITAAVVGALASAGIALAAPAQASTSNVGWWFEGAWQCDYNNGVSVAPVVITNASSVSRTGSFTVPPSITSAVQVVSSTNDINCNGGTFSSSGFSSNFTVAPGETTVMWVALGSAAQQTGIESHNIGFGGLPSGTRGAAWYDMGLTLENATTTVDGGNNFGTLTATYQNTGGTDLKTNGQDGFVLTSCQTMPDGSIYPSTSILTPYNNGAWTQGPTYDINEAICAAWMPEGTYVSYSQGPSTAFTVQAAQTYGSGGNTVAMAGSGTATITSASVSVNGGSSITVPVGGVPQSGMWVGQDPETNQWFLANAVAPSGQSVALSLNGVLVGTANAGS